MRRLRAFPRTTPSAPLDRVSTNCCPRLLSASRVRAKTTKPLVSLSTRWTAKNGPPRRFGSPSNVGN